MGYDLVESYLKEHARGTVSIRQVSPGVQCLRVVMSSSRLFSCGGDGTVKWRHIRCRDSQQAY